MARPSIRVGAQLGDIAAPVGEFLPDGRWISIDHGGVIAVWNGTTGLLERTWHVPMSEVTDLAIDPRGTYIAVEDIDRSGRTSPASRWRVIDVASGRVVRELALEYASRAMFLPDGKLLALSTDTLDEYDIATGNVVMHYDAEGAYSFGGFLLSPDRSTFVATSTRSNQLAIWQRGKPAMRLLGPAHSPTFSHGITAELALLASSHDQTWLLSLDTGAVVATWPFGARHGAVSKTTLALSTKDAVRLVDRTSKALEELPVTGELAFRPDGRVLAVGRGKPSSIGWFPKDHAPVTLWDVATGRRASSDDAAPRVLAFRGDGKRLAIATLGGVLELDLERGTFVRRGDGAVSSLAYAGDTLHVLGDARIRTFGPAGAITTIDKLDGAIWSTPAANDHWIVGGRFPRVAVIGRDGRVHADTQASEASRPPQFVALAGGTVAIGHNQGVSVWPGGAADVEHLASHDTDVTAIAARHDGARLAAGDDAGRVVIWDVANKTAIRAIDAATEPVTALAYVRDLVVVASWRDYLAIWDPETGARLATLAGQTAPALAIAGSPDGRLVTAASLDGAVRIWSVATGELVATMRATGTDWAIATPDGRWDGSSALLATTAAPPRTPGLLARVVTAAPTETRPRADAPGALPPRDDKPATCVAAKAAPFNYATVRGALVAFCVAGQRRSCWELDANAGSVTPRPVPAAYAADFTASPPIGDPAPGNHTADGKLVASQHEHGVEVRDVKRGKVVYRIAADADEAFSNYEPTTMVIGHTLVVSGSTCAGPCSSTTLYDLRRRRKVGKLDIYAPGAPEVRHARGDLWWFESEATHVEEDDVTEYVLVNVRTAKIVKRVADPRRGALTSAGIVLWPATAADPIRVVGIDGKVVRRVTLPSCS